MALLEVQYVNKVTATVKLEEPVALTVDKYAAFIHASADDVVNKALEYVFAKDKDFQKFLASSASASVAPSLQVKEIKVTDKAVKRSKKLGHLAIK